VWYERSSRSIVSQQDVCSRIRKLVTTSRTVELYLRQGQPCDSRGSLISSRHSIGYVSCKLTSATVLFDLGASHSFVSSTFAAKHHLPITIMKHTMLVSSPGGEMRTKHICPTISINIRGVDFLANFIILDSKGIDIILGMDW
jgi:hypothetical protein